MADKKRLEQIVGTIGFLDASLSNVDPAQEAQFVGLFRVSPGEDEYMPFFKRVTSHETHEGVRAALETEDPLISIVCASKLLKSLVNSLEFPLIPLSFALEPFDAGHETDKAVIGAVLAESFLQSIARTHAGEDAAAWAATGAQLFALLCHTSRRPLTKMNEYALSVCFLPTLAGSRSSKPEDLMEEQKQIMKFQTNRRAGAVALATRLESYITYGRRIWGAIYDCLPTLQADLAEMSKTHKQGTRRPSMVYRFIQRASIPLSLGSRPQEDASTKPKAPDGRRPSLIQRAFSQPADRRQGRGDLVAAPPTSRLDATFIGQEESSPSLASPATLAKKAAGKPPAPLPSRMDEIPAVPAFIRTASNSQAKGALVTKAPGAMDVPMPPARTPSGLPPLQARRGSSAGSGIGSDTPVSATIKAAAEKSAMKRRTSRDAIVAPQLDSQGSFRKSGSGRRLDGISGDQNGGENVKALNGLPRPNSGRSSNPIDITNLDLKSAPETPNSKKDRQVSLGDIGRHMIQTLNAQTSASPRFEEHDSDLL